MLSGQVVYSTLSAQAAADFACSCFDIGPPTEARLVNRGFNDVYQLDDRFLRIGRPGRRTLDEAEGEALALLELRTASLSVATAVRGRDGRFAQRLPLVEGDRTVLLFDKAPGVEAQQTPEHAHAQGAALASVHACSLSGSTTAHVRRLDAEQLIARSLILLAGPLAIRPEVMERVTKAGENLQAWFEPRRSALSVGYCHGDCHGYNATIERDTATLFDFDESGLGWLAYDLGVYLWSVTMHMPDSRRRLWPHFLAGYRSRKVLASPDLESIEAMVALREFWSFGAWAEGAPYWGDHYLRSVDAVQRLDRLVERVDRLAEPRLLV